MSNNGLKQHKVGVIGIVGMIYAMTAAGAYGIEDKMCIRDSFPAIR